MAAGSGNTGITTMKHAERSIFSIEYHVGDTIVGFVPVGARPAGTLAGRFFMGRVVELVNQYIVIHFYQKVHNSGLMNSHVRYYVRTEPFFMKPEIFEYLLENPQFEQEWIDGHDCPGYLSDNIREFREALDVERDPRAGISR